MPRRPVLTIKNPNTVATDHETKIQGGTSANGTAADLGAVVLRVSVVVAAVPLGVTLAGENVQLEAGGRPLQANVTVETTPFIGTTEMLNVAFWPAWMIAELGEADSSKSPAEFPTTKVWEVVLGKISASPTYSAEMA